MEDLEKQFITSYESHLAKEGKEICKEVYSIIGDNDELMVEKADTYSRFISNSKVDGFDPMLIDRCRNYLNDTSILRDFKNTLFQAGYKRKEKKDGMIWEYEAKRNIKK